MGCWTAAPARFPSKISLSLSLLTFDFTLRMKPITTKCVWNRYELDLLCAPSRTLDLMPASNPISGRRVSSATGRRDSGATIASSAANSAMIGFCAVLYEMLTASELTSATLRTWGSGQGPPSAPGPLEVWEIIDSTFFPFRRSGRPPTIAELLASSIFADSNHTAPLAAGGGRLRAPLEPAQESLIANAREHYRELRARSGKTTSPVDIAVDVAAGPPSNALSDGVTSISTEAAASESEKLQASAAMAIAAFTTAMSTVVERESQAMTAPSAPAAKVAAVNEGAFLDVDGRIGIPSQATDRQPSPVTAMDENTPSHARVSLTTELSEVEGDLSFSAKFGGQPSEAPIDAHTVDPMLDVASMERAGADNILSDTNDAYVHPAPPGSLERYETAAVAATALVADVTEQHTIHVADVDDDRLERHYTAEETMPAPESTDAIAIDERDVGAVNNAPITDTVSVDAGGIGADRGAPSPVGRVDQPLTAAELSRLTNKNLLSDYTWFKPLLEQIAANHVPRSTDLSSGATLLPIFLVAGACPYGLVGMQVVMYAVELARPSEPHVTPTSPLAIDFWWIKPQAAKPSQLEFQTLNRHAKGAHKNDPGRSRALYLQFADLFIRGPSGKNSSGPLRFGVEVVDGSLRAFSEQVSTGERYYFYLIWQEDWTTNPFARSKYIIGKLVYQRDPRSSQYYARPYAYRDGVLSIPTDSPEEVLLAIFPPDRIKLNCQL